MGWILFFFVSGMALILLEFILPGGIIGVAGVIMLVISCGIGVTLYPDFTLLIVLGEVLGAGIAIGIGIYVISKTSLGSAMVLSGEQRAEDGYTNLPSDMTLIGMQGVVLTALRPAGTIEVGEKRLDAVSDGTFIDKGALVVITEVHGNRVVVERAEEATTTQSA